MVEAGLDAGVIVTLSPSSKRLPKVSHAWFKAEEQAAPMLAVQEPELDVAVMVSAMFTAALARECEAEQEQPPAADPKPDCCVEEEQEQQPDVDVAGMVAAMFGAAAASADKTAVQKEGDVASSEAEAGPEEQAEDFDAHAFVARVFLGAVAADAVQSFPVEDDGEESVTPVWQSPTKSNFIPVFETTEEYLARLEVEQLQAQQQREMEEEEAEEQEQAELGGGYIPRGRCVSPIDKKIKAIQEEWANVPFDPKPHVSRLEREVTLTRCAVPSPSRAAAQKMAQAAFENSLRSHPAAPSVPPLSEVLRVHKSKLELDKEAAVAAAAAEVQQPQRGSRVAAPAWEGPSLSEIGTHKGRLEREKEAAVAAAATETQLPKRSSRVVTPAWEGPSLAEIGTHKSRLEREKEAATVAAAAEPQQPKRGSRVVAPAWEGPSLGEIGTHKSRLEQEKEAATAAAAMEPQQPKRGSRVAAPAWEGPSLDEIGTHKSRLEREKEAAAAAPAVDQHQLRRGGQVASTAWEGPGLCELKPHKSKLEREREAWLAAEAKIQQRRDTSNTVLSSLTPSAQPTEDAEVVARLPTPSQ